MKSLTVCPWPSLPLFGLLLVAGLLAGPLVARERPVVVSKWDRFERGYESVVDYGNPFQEAEFKVTFTSPSGARRTVPGFWDGGRTWRVRFLPDEVGRWTYRTWCSKASDIGLHDLTGEFVGTAPTGKGRFGRHGPVQVSADRRHLEHADRTPFFWLADTAWNGPLKATDRDWDFYVHKRARQTFTAVQWVTTQWRAAPDGDAAGTLAYTGTERIEINPAFFRRLDRRVDAMNRAGLLSVPVLLWAIQGGANPQINPGVSLPDDQAIRLARYMVARWQANAVVWLLGGDGDYRGPKAEKWRKLGRGVFGDIAHAPATMHPGGRQWVLDEFQGEAWYDFCGYQSGHDAGDGNLKWITSGPPATDWRKEPARPFLSLEAPYENHNGGERQPMTADVVRRAHYWSILNAPPVGITYGAHGVWGWDDGTQPPVDHPGSGTPFAWAKAMLMPAAEQMGHLHRLFVSVEFWNLEPAPDILADQPGRQSPSRFVSAARSRAGDRLVVYVPQDRTVALRLAALPAKAQGKAFNPRTGEWAPVVGLVTDQTVAFTALSEGDWVLVITGAAK